MKLPVYAYGHPVLRKKCEIIDKDYAELSILLADMWETMYHTKGVGLAAPQIGRNIRLFIVDTIQLNDDDDEDDNEEREIKERNLKSAIKKVFINPTIVAESGKVWAYEEGCLSIPEIRGKVMRQPQLRIQYYDEKFNFYDEVFDDMNARVIQHEHDHIEGILFTDHLPPLKKIMLKKRLDKIQKGEINAKYKMVFAAK